MFTRIKQKIFANKNSLIKMAIFLGFYFILSDFAFAQGTGGTETAVGAAKPNMFESAKSTIVEVFTWVTTTVSLLLGLMTYLVSMFLSPEWTSGSLFGMNVKFKEIWIFISNIVYLAFAFILIFIAFMNIIGKGDGNFAFKQAIPKFIIGILIVPFSWFLVNFLISLSSVLFIGVMNLPSDTFSDYNTVLKNTKVPRNCTIDFSSLTESEGNSKIYDCEPKPEGNNPDNRVSVEELLSTGSSSESVFGVLATYTYNILKIDEFDKIEKNDFINIKNIGDLIVKIVFDLLFIIVYALLMLALGMALVMRGIRLWIFIMLSPLFGLMYFFGKENGGSGFFEKFNLGNLFSLVMVPVYTMLALSFGLLFIHLLGDGMSGNKGGDISHMISIKDITPSENNGVKETKFQIGGNADNQNTGITLTVKGALPEYKQGTENVKQIGGDALGIIGNLILKIFGIIVLWGAVIAALKSSKITEQIIAPIAEFGDSIGKAASSIPQYTPILPGGQSLASLRNAGASLDSAMREKYGVSERASNLLNIAGLQKSIIDNKYDEYKTMGPIDDISKVGNIMNMLQEIYKNKQDAMFKDSKVQEMMVQIGFDRSKLSSIRNLDAFSKEWASIETNKSGIHKLGLDKEKTEQFMKGERQLPGTSQPQKISLDNNGKLPQDINIDLGNVKTTISQGKGVPDIVALITQTRIDETKLRTALENAKLDDSVISEVIIQAKNGGKITPTTPTNS